MEEKKYLKWYNKIGYGSGDIAGNVVYAFLTSFMMVYLTDSVGLAAGVVGTLIAVSKLFDGFTDIFFGSMIDKTHSKMGKAKPWMLYGYIGCAITLVCCFAVPVSLGTTAKYAWFFISYTLLNGVFYTANNIAYSALTSLITKNSKERVQMGSYRFIFAFSTSLLIQAITVGFVDKCGGDAAAWRTVAIIYAIIGLVINTISALSVKELPEEELNEGEVKDDNEKYGMVQAFKLYVDTKEEIIAINRKSKHIKPHLHNALEIVCVTSGALELGVGQELYHMEKGDIGFVFPDVIHHYQVLTPGVNKATYLIASPFTIVKFADIMQSMAPEYPIIKAEKVEPEVYRVINAILETEQSDITVAQAYLQIVLARCIGKLNLVEKSNVGSNDLIYQTVSYISANFKKKFSLEEMAKDLGVSKYVLSRLFSKTFHRNFNQYLNDVRLNYACQRLENTSDSITNICLDSGFESQRTFNRVFKERYKISPSDYRSTCLKDMLS